MKQIRIPNDKIRLFEPHRSAIFGAQIVIWWLFQILREDSNKLHSWNYGCYTPECGTFLAIIHIQSGCEA